jgi:hypothetical protein
MFTAGVEFALGVGAGCILFYGAFLFVSFAWFGIEQLLLVRTRRGWAGGPRLLRTANPGLPALLSSAKSSAVVDVGLSAR